ncbi:BTB/POZ domain-containing protein [Ditylenchus destructor]|uniref:BTB/POZ domain-containing protein n=1 Tax=Ditylenchus destructor TaxID=166010 RepID=A0AAD4NBA8_9BILA|nr:BTB/POZ domain-containing protein [Ditylenchus destructor]
MLGHPDVLDTAQIQHGQISLQCILSTDEEGNIPVNRYDDENGDVKRTDGLMFKANLVSYILMPRTSESGKLTIEMSAIAQQPNVEWRFLVQMAIVTQSSQPDGTLKKSDLADSDVFEFGNRIPPLIIIIDGNIVKLKLGIRYVHKMYNVLPKFDDGDVLLRFTNEKDEEVCTYEALLRMHSPVLAHALDQTATREGGQKILTIDCCNANSFRELLYQIYPIQRPIYADFRALCNAAVAFKVKTVLDKLCEHLVNYEHLNFEEKISEASKLGLDEAIEELIYNAVKSGQWASMINRGFNPKAMFPEKTYFGPICEAVIKAKTLESNTYCRNLKQSIDFTSNSLANDSSFIHLKVQGKSYFVNRGLLAIYNNPRFAVGNNGEYCIAKTVKLESVLAKYELRMHDVIEQLLHYLYGHKRVLDVIYLRPLIVFADYYKMEQLKSELEDMLLLEPPISPEKLLDHLYYAHHYNLTNLERLTLVRMDGSYQEVAQKVVQIPDFKHLLDAEFQEKIKKSMNALWSKMFKQLTLNNRMYKSLPAPARTRYVSDNGHGGPLLPVEELDLATLVNMNPDDIFGEEQELIVLP